MHLPVLSKLHHISLALTTHTIFDVLFRQIAENKQSLQHYKQASSALENALEKD
jgi:hypothetical protein